MPKPDLVVRDPVLCIFQLLIKVFLPQDRIEKLQEIMSLTANSGLAIQFLFKFCFRNHLIGYRLSLVQVAEWSREGI